jgi:hypothetical protein
MTDSSTDSNNDSNNDPNNDSSVAPSFKLNRFSCPSCKQLSDQAWFNTYADQIRNGEGVPLRIAGADLERLSQNSQFPPDVREQKVAYWNKVNNGEVFLDRWAPVQTDTFVAGMELSVCHACLQLAVWLGGEMVHPRADK